MSNIVKIGKVSRFYGRAPFQILVNLKSFGKDRILERISATQQHGKKTFLIVKDAAPQMDENLVHGYLYCEYYYQEMRVPGLTELLPQRPDYRLIHKDEEKPYREIAEKAPVLGQDVPQKLLPQYYKVPPLMAEVLNRRKLRKPPCLYVKGLTKESYGYDHESLIKLRIPYVYNLNSMEQLMYRVADESKGEFVEEKPLIFVDRLLPKKTIEKLEE